MNDVLVLLKRDVKNSFNKRLFILLAFTVLFQCWFILGSDSVGQVRDSGMMHYMAVVFSFNFFGSIIALALNYDGISGERESKFMDLILTSGITKKKLYFSKVLTSFIISCIFALLYVSILALVYLAMSGKVGMGLMTFKYFLPLTAFLLVFSLMGLMLSIILRSSKAALITSIIIGGLFMPRLFVMIVDSLSALLGLSDKAAEVLYLISPAFIMNSLTGYSETSYVMWGLLFLTIYFLTLISLGIQVFVKQDELNYGE